MPPPATPHRPTCTTHTPVQRHGRHQRLHARGGRAAAAGVPQSLLHRRGLLLPLSSFPLHSFRISSPGTDPTALCAAWLGGLHWCRGSEPATAQPFRATLAAADLHPPQAGVNDWGLRCLRRLQRLRCLNLDSRHFSGEHCCRASSHQLDLQGIWRQHQAVAVLVQGPGPRAAWRTRCAHPLALLAAACRCGCGAHIPPDHPGVLRPVCRPRLRCRLRRPQASGWALLRHARCPACRLRTCIAAAPRPTHCCCRSGGMLLYGCCRMLCPHPCTRNPAALPSLPSPAAS